MISSWLNKFSDIEEFIKYFNKWWLVPKRSGWYDHYCDFCPCQNNALEGTNRYVKDEGTLRQRLGVLQFLNLLENGFVKRWSTNRNPSVEVLVNSVLVEQININLKKFNEEPIINLQDYTCAYQWDKLGKVFSKVKRNSVKLHFVPSSDNVKEVNTKACNDFLDIDSWSDYHSFLIHASKTLHVVEFNIKNWKLSKCSCWKWCKEYKCKHILCFAERELIFDYPIQAKRFRLVVTDVEVDLD